VLGAPCSVARSAATRSAHRSQGIGTNIVNRVVRSTRVAICDLSLLPMMRTPSQKPGTARSQSLGGAFADIDHVRDLPLFKVALDRGTRLARPCRNCEFKLSAQLAFHL
jgi:hypothetical protein